MSMPKSRQLVSILQRLAVTLVCMYLLSPFGANFNGVALPDSQLITLGLAGATLVSGGVMRLRHSRKAIQHKKWRWHRSALDAALPLWLLAFAASTLANPDALRRSQIALGFVALYIAVWYCLYDWLANRPSAKALIVDGILGGGALLMTFSALEILHTGRFLQLASLIGNANALGSVLVLLIPLALKQAWRARPGMPRALWSSYSACAVVNLALTLSRGAWLGFFAACCALFVLLLAHYRLLSPAHFLAWWGRQKRRTRRLALFAMFAVSLCLICATALIMVSFTLPERSLSLRSALWRSALSQFSDAPLFGKGLFTFGKHSAQHLSIPPAQNYAHAHNLPLNIAAEMGMLGLAAFGATVLLIARRWRSLWRSKNGAERLDWFFHVAPVLGLSLHLCFDITVMMPAVALLGLVTLVLSLDPGHGSQRISEKMGRLCAWALTLLWICLLALGYRSWQANSRYLAALRLAAAAMQPNIHSAKSSQGEAAADMLSALDALDELAAQDPAMPVYHLQSALLWGQLAASGIPGIPPNGEKSCRAQRRLPPTKRCIYRQGGAISQAIAAFERFLRLEPYQASAWANLGALQWQAGDRAAALQSMGRARGLAPRLPLFAIKLYQYRNDDPYAPIALPHRRYNQDFTRYQFLRESLPVTFLPQIAWNFQQPWGD